MTGAYDIGPSLGRTTAFPSGGAHLECVFGNLGPPGRDAGAFAQSAPEPLGYEVLLVVTHLKQWTGL
jgi:hypothetical protein